MRALFTTLSTFNLSQVFPLKRPAHSAAQPRFQFNPAGHLLFSTDEGQHWQEAVRVEPGYKHLRLWREGAATRLRLEYADHCVELLSTDGSQWTQIQH
jgi:hypothetical protein